MIGKIRNSIIAASLGTLFLTLGQITAHSAEPLAKPEIEKIVRDYLLKNPAILLEMQEALQAQEQEQIAERQAETIRDNKEAIYSSKFQIEMGDPNAPVTIIEFFDYNCGFCQRALADMQQLLEQDKGKVRFILKEFPVLGEQSIEAARVSMAFSKLMPEKHAEFHVKLLGLDGIKDGARALQVAEELGADTNELIGKMEDADIIGEIGETYQVADGLGITGTPSYLIGDNVIFGAVGLDQLRVHIATVENKNSQ
jgi:protein-disulfide isomerase